MICMASPTAARILRKGSTARESCAGVIAAPWLDSAAKSKGQIFMPVMPCASRLSASAPASVRKPSRSSYGPAAGWPMPQLSVFWPAAPRT